MVTKTTAIKLCFIADVYKYYFFAKHQFILTASVPRVRVNFIVLFIEFLWILNFT